MWAYIHRQARNVGTPGGSGAAQKEMAGGWCAHTPQHLRAKEGLENWDFGLPVESAFKQCSRTSIKLHYTSFVTIKVVTACSRCTPDEEKTRWKPSSNSIHMVPIWLLLAVFWFIKATKRLNTGRGVATQVKLPSTTPSAGCRCLFWERDTQRRRVRE